MLQMEDKSRALLRAAPKKNESELWCSDVFVTCVIGAMGLYEFVRGVVNHVDPSSPAGTLAGHVPFCTTRDPKADERVVDMARLTAVGSIESGLGAFVVSVYRLYRWYKGSPFNPFGIVVALVLDLVGTVLRLIVISRSVSEMSGAYWSTLWRAVVSIVTLGFAVLAYKSWLHRNQCT